MHTFRSATRTKSVMFSVSYDDGRVAYLVVDNHGGSSEDHLVSAIVKERQGQGLLPQGSITGYRRVR